ncbi:MAG TPA: hypothetical protein VN631_00645 [Negativicutes bacterium]|nr:hypothetical protein [Negativicutes bacterium]
MKKHKTWLLLLLFVIVAVAIVPAAQAIDLGSIIKVAGIGILVDQFGPQLNSFINTLMAQHNATPDFATKVVPILTVGVLGNSGYIGAAQVMGPQNLVDRVQAVVQVESSFNGNMFRVKGLIPIDSKVPVKFNRVSGVGVSAMIDVRI